ncbi:hypothetical protein EV360DRAFT_77083, partial [Lentinula raphanica]
CFLQKLYCILCLVKQRVGFDIFDYTDLRDSIEDYAKQNKLTTQSDTRDLLRKVWRDFKEDRMWFCMNKDKHDGLSDAEFDAILRSRFLGATWPSEVLSLNCELQGTNYFFDNKQLLALLSDGLIRAFREDLVYEKLEITPSTDLDQWISSVVDFETRSRWRHPRPANSNSNFPLTSSLSHNTSSAVRQMPRHNTGPISVEEITSLVQKSKSSKNNHFAGRLPESDKRLLDLIETCYRCRTGWAGHRSMDPACPGIRLEVPYRPPTTQMMNKAIEIHKAKGCAITYNALLKAFPEVPSVSSVSSLPVLDDISGFDSLPSVPASHHMSPPMTTVAGNPYGSYPVSAVIPDSTLYHARPLCSYQDHRLSHDSCSSSCASTPSAKPLASVVPRRGRWSDFVETDIVLSDSEDEQPLPVSSVAPAAPPSSSHLRSASDSAPPEKRRQSDEHGSSFPVSSTSSSSISAPVASVSSGEKDAHNGDVAGVEVDRLVGLSESTTRVAELLIDSGCPFVLIDTNMVTSLGLKSRRLHVPRAMTLAMSDGQPQ